MVDEHDKQQRVSQMLEEAGEPDSLYLEKLQDIFCSTSYSGVPYEPTMIHGLVYLGTQANAENLDSLRRHKIKHVLNCAGVPESLYHARAARYKNTDISYSELPIDDGELDSIIGFFGQANNCIDKARMQGERILIHCTGVSRSGAIAMGYLISAGKKLLDAAKDLKKERRVVLCHDGFMEEIVAYARAQGMLDISPYDMDVPRYGRAMDVQRLKYAHLPDYLVKYGDKWNTVYS